MELEACSITPNIDSKMTTTATEAVTAPSKQAKVMESFTSLISCALNATDSQPFRSSAVKLPFLISASQDSSTSCCAVSSLQLRNKQVALKPQSSKPVLQDAAASNLRQPLEVRKSELQNLPTKLLWNVSQSFMSLVDSRLRSSLTNLVRQSRGRSQEDDTLTPILVGLLASSSSSPINPTTIVTTFRTPEFSERNADGDYILPIIFEAVLDLNILGNTITVTVEAPGTVQGTFSCNVEEAKAGASAELLKVDIQIDTATLLISMMSQARMAVRKAVGFATVVASHVLLLSSSCADSNSRSSSNSSLLSMNSTPSLQTELVRSHVVECPIPGSGSENDLMPPPPARARSSTSMEFLNKTISSSSAGVGSNKNHSWDDRGGKVPGKRSLSGLNLLTTALSGLEQESNDGPSDLRPDSKKQRIITAAGTESTSTSKFFMDQDQEQPSSHADDDFPEETYTNIAEV
jgi:hypothetical protein